MERVDVVLGSSSDHPRDYPIHIGAAALERLPSLLRAAGAWHRYALISDSNVAPLYASSVMEVLHQSGATADLFTFPAGEVHKNRQSWGDLTDAMLGAGLGRDAAVLALGGGVTGDLAGFVAATYLRGLPLIQLPTSLLAMIDSSVGGKTGIDVPAGKNLVGAFHQPHFVLADTDTLRTLEPREVRAGLAEAMKHGAIADPDYFDWITGGAEGLLALEAGAIAQLIRRSVEIKAAVVSADEREGGLRKTLNFGHTLGHAIEAHSKFQLLHGEAIAIGMVAEAELGEALSVTAAGTADRLRSTADRLGLPIALPAGFSLDEIVHLTRVDKKARSGRVEYALIERIGTSSRGTGSYGLPVEDDSALEALRRCVG